MSTKPRLLGMPGDPWPVTAATADERSVDYRAGLAEGFRRGVEKAANLVEREMNEFVADRSWAFVRDEIRALLEDEKP